MPLIDRSKVWTGKINEIVLPKPTQTSVRFYDTTLRDGEQSVGVIFDPDQKLEIARLLDDMGIDRIEAGFPRVSDEDNKAIAQIAAAGLKAEIWGFARAIVKDVKAVADLGLRHSIIEAPLSDYKLDALGVSHETILGRIKTAVEFAVQEGISIAFFGVDSTRADLGFLEQAYKTAQDAGASEFVLVDTLAIAAPESVSYLVHELRKWTGGKAPIHFHGHNDFGLGTASAIAAVNAGAEWIHGTIDGIGERAGNANLSQIALALGLLYGVESNLRLDKVRGASNRLRQIAGYELEPWKPLVGDNLFVRETGAVAAQFHLPYAVEPYSAELLATPRGIVLGKKSGLASISIKCHDLNLDVPVDKHPALLAAVKELAIKKHGLLTDADFQGLVKTVA
jgi:isopropylmalate/homocitrate/citramalate synthase